MTVPPAPQSRFLDPGDAIAARIWDGDRAGTVLLIHGMGDSAWIWAPMIAEWPEPRPTFVALDLPGHGDSRPVPRREMRTDRLANRLAGVLSRQVAAPQWVAGHSAGARVAVDLLRRGGLDARGLTIIDTADDHAPAIRDRLFAHVAGLRRGAPNIAGIVAGIAAADATADPALLTAYIRAAARHDGALWRVPVSRGAEAMLSGDADIAAGLAGLDCPVQVIRGAMSSICTAAMADRFADACRKPLPVRHIAMAGHAICMSRPAELAAAMSGAVAATAGPDGALRRSG